jgi:hypothetical protein
VLDVEELFDLDTFIDPTTRTRGHGSWGPTRTARNLRPGDPIEAVEIFGRMDARRHLDRCDRLTPTELADRQSGFCRVWGIRWVLC